jgi:hypothetical protein
MTNFNENLTVDGQIEVSRPWADWVLLRQQRDQEGGGGFVIHNPWGNASIPQGAADRNRLEIAYRTPAGQTQWGHVVIHGPTGNVGIGTVSPQARLHVQGDIMATGDVRLDGADCAEEFELAVEGLPDPGTVMVLAEDGRLRPSEQAYDARVAGVVSGAGRYRPALVLDRRCDRQDQDRRVPIALVGKVYCRVDSAYAPIDVGDLLTTSPTRGHAMRVVDPGRALGAIIGKALRPMNRGAELIPILVSLQ